MSQPDLFVVCKNCGSEVSPYVTECPYCGQRVRKRAPKLDRPGTPEEEPRPRRRRRQGPRLPRLRAEEIEGIAPDRRPYGTAAIVAACAVGLVLSASGVEPTDLGAISLDTDEAPWRFVTAPFVFADRLAYAFVALLAVGVFGAMLERRFGLLVPVLIFILSGAAGSALATVVGPEVVTGELPAFVFGANGAALGLLSAWVVDNRLAARRGAPRDADMLGVAVAAVVLVLLSLPVVEANLAAAVGGAAAGAVLGLLLRPLARA